MKKILVINPGATSTKICVFEDDKVLIEDQILTNDKVLEYIKQNPTFTVCGNAAYLGVEGKEPDIARELFNLWKVSSPVEDPLALKPVYMKD